MADLRALIKSTTLEEVVLVFVTQKDLRFKGVSTEFLQRFQSLVPEIFETIEQ